MALQIQQVRDEVNKADDNYQISYFKSGGMETARNFITASTASSNLLGYSRAQR